LTALRRLLLLVAFLCLPLTAMAQEESDAGFIARQIESALSSSGGRDVRITGFQGALSSTATMTSLTIADAEGIWLRADNLRMNWNRAALLARRIDIRELSAESITILRAPISESSDTPSPEATPFALPQLPVSISIGSLDIGRLVLEAPVIGQEVALSLTGTVGLTNGAVNTNLTASRIDGQDGTFSLIAAYSENSGVLSLVLSIEEAADGIVATLARLPGTPSLRAQIAGSGPIDDYRATLLVATDGATRLTGEATTTATPDDGRTFGLRAQGDITALVLPDYHDFFGPFVRLVLEGRIEGDGTFDLSTLDLASRALTLTGNARVAPDGWPSQITLDGQIAQASGLPVTLPIPGADISVGNVSLDVTYDIADDDAWTGDFRISSLAMPALQLPSLTLAGGGAIVPRRGDTPGRLAANLTYAATGLALTDTALAQAIGQDITGEIRLSRNGDNPFQIGLLTVEGPGIGVEAEGTIAGPAADFLTQTSVRLRAEDASRFAALAGLALGGAADVAIVSSVEPLNGIFDAILTGTTRDLRVGIPQADALLAGDGALTIAAVRDENGTRITGLTINTPALTATASADITSADSRATFDIRLPDAAVALPELPGPAALTGTITRTSAGALTLDAQAQANGVNSGIDVTVAAADAGGAIIGSVTAEIADLSAFADLANRPLAGAAEVMLSGQLAPDLASFDITAFGRTQNLAIGIPQVDALLTGDGALDGRISRTGPGSLSVTDFRVTTDALTATGTADLTPDGGTADLDLRLADIGSVVPVVPGLSGPATVTGTATRNAAGDTTLALDATGPGATARVDGTLSPDFAFAGTVAAQVPDLAPYAALAGQPVSGGVNLTATGRVSPDLTDIDLRLTGTTTNLQSGVAQIDPLLLGTGTVDIDVTGTFPDALTIRSLSVATPGVSLTGEGTFVRGEGIAALTLSIPDIAPVAPGFSGPATLTGVLGRDTTGLYQLEAAVTGPSTTANVTATIKPPEFGNHTDLSITADVGNLATYSGLVGVPLGGSFNGTITGSITPGANAFDLTVNATATNLDPGNPTAARLLRGNGTVAGRVSLGTDARLLVRGLDVRFPNFTITGDIGANRNGGEARIDARLADLALIAPDFSGPATLQGTGTLDATGNWRVQADATGPGGTNARVNGTIAPGLNLNLTATGSAPLGLANVFIDPNRIEGTAAFDLRIQGRPALDAVSGNVTIRDAILVLPGAQQSLAGIGGTVSLGSGSARVDISGSPELGGRVTATGTVGLAAPFTAALDVTGSGIVLRDPNLYDTTVDARIRVSGPLTGGALIAGRVDVGPTEIRVPTSPLGFGGGRPVVEHRQPSAPVVETLARAGLTTAGVPPGDTARGGSGSFILDILISAPGRVFIRGRGLDVELGGEIAIRGSTAAPIPTGAFRLIRGRLDILQQRFILTEGTIDLRGGFVPIIRLVAGTTTRTGIDAIIIIEGEVSEPTLTVSSIPELPQDEVLAQLLFGRNLSSITPLQAIQLASAVATLAGRGGGGIIEGFRDQLGIDSFDVTTDNQGNAAVQAGIYLTDKLYTEAIVSSDETEINLNFDVSRDVTVRGSVTSEGDTAVGIYFERDY
jgi:translocation and assembly module TamB